jgi:hypothetical protein
MMKPRYQRGLNESWRTAKQAITVGTREDSLEVGKSWIEEDIQLCSLEGEAIETRNRDKRRLC